MSPGAANLFPFFSEENNPLYLDPAERAANEASQAQGNRDTVSKRTKREVRSRARSRTLVLTHTLPKRELPASPPISLTAHPSRAPPCLASLASHAAARALTGARRGDDLPHAALGLLVRALPLRVSHHLPRVHRAPHRRRGGAHPVHLVETHPPRRPHPRAEGAPRPPTSSLLHPRPWPAPPPPPTPLSTPSCAPRRTTRHPSPTAKQVWDDRSLHNVDFSMFCPMFTLKEINHLEKKFLELIEYDVSVSGHAPTPAPTPRRTRPYPSPCPPSPLSLSAPPNLPLCHVAFAYTLTSSHSLTPCTP